MYDWRAVGRLQKGKGITGAVLTGFCHLSPMEEVSGGQSHTNAPEIGAAWEQGTALCPAVLPWSEAAGWGQSAFSQYWYLPCNSSLPGSLQNPGSLYLGCPKQLHLRYLGLEEAALSLAGKQQLLLLDDWGCISSSVNSVEAGSRQCQTSVPGIFVKKIWQLSFP